MFYCELDASAIPRNTSDSAATATSNFVKWLYCMLQWQLNIISNDSDSKFLSNSCCVQSSKMIYNQIWWKMIHSTPYKSYFWSLKSDFICCVSESSSWLNSWSLWKKGRCFNLIMKDVGSTQHRQTAFKIASCCQFLFPLLIRKRLEREISFE